MMPSGSCTAVSVVIPLASNASAKASRHGDGELLVALLALDVLQDLVTLERRALGARAGAPVVV